MFVELQLTHCFMTNASLVLVKETTLAPSRICQHLLQWHRVVIIYIMLTNLHEDVIMTLLQHKLRSKEALKFQGPEIAKCKIIDMPKQNKSHYIALDKDISKPFAITIFQRTCLDH